MLGHVKDYIPGAAQDGYNPNGFLFLSFKKMPGKKTEPILLLQNKPNENAYRNDELENYLNPNEDLKKFLNKIRQDLNE